MNNDPEIAAAFTRLAASKSLSKVDLSRAEFEMACEAPLHLSEVGRLHLEAAPIPETNRLKARRGPESMTGNIPREPSWCSLCRCPEHYGAGSPCPSHCGADGKTVAYAGQDSYEPSDWVRRVVGKRYRGFDGTFLCDGYDPRHGFWMR